MHASLLIFAWLAFFVCYLPFILRMDFYNVLAPQNENNMPLKTALTSNLFEQALVASVAAATPMVIELFADTFTTGFRFTSVNHYAVFSKWILLSAMIVPNIIILTVVIPSSNYAIIPCIFQSRQIVLFYALMTFMGLYGNPIWTPNMVKFLVVLFSIGNIAAVLLAFSFFADKNSLKIIQFTTALISSLILVYLSLRWFYLIGKKIFLDKLSISVDEYYCNIHVLSMMVAIFGLWAVTIMYFGVTWGGRDDLYLVLVTYLEVVYTVILGIWNGRISRREFAIMQTTQELETKRMFVRYVSHEIRTPLNSVVMGLKLLQSELAAISVDDDVVDIVRDLTTSCKEAVHILDDLLTYEKLSANILSYVPSLFLVKTFIRFVMNPYFLQAKETGIRLEITFLADLSPADVDVMLLADKSKLAQVVCNLVSNALKFTKRGGKVVLAVSHQIPHKRMPRSISRKVVVTDHANAMDPEDGKTMEDYRTHRRAGALTLLGRGSGSGGFVVENSLAANFPVESPDLPLVVGGGESRRFQPPPRDSRRAISAGRSFGLRANPLRASARLVAATGAITAVDPLPVPDVLRIDVIDTGPGISKENQKRLFKEIVQFNPGELQDGAGSGLGLWISSRIMELHKGSLTMTSEGLGFGCTFTAQLPVQEVVTIAEASPEKDDEDDADATQRPLAMSSNRISSRSSSVAETELNEVQQLVGSSGDEDPVAALSSRSTGRVDLHRLRVMLVDDAPLNRKFLRRLLNLKCLSIVEAEDGRQALDLVLASLVDLSPRIDLIITDFQMPVMTGPAAVKQMRSAGYKGIIIGLTGNALPCDIDLFLAHGADRVLIKPLLMENLESALESIFLSR